MLLLADGDLKPDTLGIDDLNDQQMAGEQRIMADRLMGNIIPHPVVCPNCGAANCYSVTTRTPLGVMLFSYKHRSSWRLQRAKCITAVGNIHPLVAAVHYRYLLLRNPSDHLTRIRMANCLSLGGEWAQAQEHYGMLVEDSTVPIVIRAEAALNLAILAGCGNDEEAMKEFCRRGLHLCHSAGSRAAKKPSCRGISVTDIADHLKELSHDLDSPGYLDLDGLLQCLVWIRSPE